MRIANKQTYKTLTRYLSMFAKSVLKPNILIWSRNKAEFDALKTSMQDLLGKLSYTIYPIDISTESEFQKSNCVVLVTALERSDEETRSEPSVKGTESILVDYLKQGGRILTFNADPNRSQSNLHSVYSSDGTIQTSRINEFALKYSHVQSQGVHLVLSVSHEFGLFSHLEC